jgi:SEC-C motif
MDKNNEFMKELETYFDESTQTEQKKFWKYTYKGNNLATLLQGLTVEQLNTIGSTLAIPNRSKLKKAELVELIKQDLPMYMLIHINSFNEKHFTLIDKIIENKGIIPYSPIDIQLIDYLFDCGVIFPVLKNNERVLIMSKEIIRLLKEVNERLHEDIKFNTEVINTTYGLLHYYGVIPVMTWHNLMKNYFPNLKLHEIMSILRTDMECFARIDRYDYYMACSGMDREELTSLIAKQNRYDFDYFPINKFRAIQASPADYLERSPQVNRLYNFIIERFEIDPEDLLDSITEVVDLIKLGYPTSVYLKAITEEFEFEDMRDIQELASITMDIHNHTRMWELKGHTPNEVGKLMGHELPKIPSQKPITIKAVKVGRNEPCPCGSGKKYKHCCIDKE